MAMNCERFEERLMDLLDRRLAAAEEAEMRLHLASCPRCHESFREIEELIAATRATPQENPPAGFADSVMASVAQDERARRRRGLFRLVSLGAAGSLAAGFLLFLAFQSSAPLSPKEWSDAKSDVAVAKADDKLQEPARSSALQRKTRAAAQEESLGVAAQELDNFDAPIPAERAAGTSQVYYMASLEKDAPEAKFLESFQEVAEEPALRDETSSEDLLRSKDSSEGAGLTAKLGQKERKVSEKEKNEEASNKGEIPEGARVFRVRVPRERLASLRQEWRQIPGLHIEEANSLAEFQKKNSQRRLAGSPPSPSGPTPLSLGEKRGHSGTYRGPGDTVPSGKDSENAAADPDKAEWVELVIVLLAAEPAKQE